MRCCVKYLNAPCSFQIYMFTATGIQDRGPNRLTQFVGMLLRPKDFDDALENKTNAILNGH